MTVDPNTSAGSSQQESTSSDFAPPDIGKRGKETSIRVNVSLLDSLMTLAGELVLCRNQLMQTLNTSSFKDADTVGQRIDLITSELQEAIMLTRMQPIGNVFTQFPRLVRDLSADLGKKIDIAIHGKEVELDKTIIEAIDEPLTHLISGAVYHGIELPQERTKKGKSETGHIFLKAYHEAGQVVIEIGDDGRGIDGEKVAAQAVLNGVITSEQQQILTAAEKLKLIFLPGFSSSESEKGDQLGLDTVKNDLDKLGGNIDIVSERNTGTTISIKLPLTLAIIPCQIIETEGERYAIPQLNLDELLRIPASQIRERIERVGDAEVVRLRGKLLPIVRLTDILGITTTYTDPATGTTHPDRRRRLADRRSKQHNERDHSEKTATPLVDNESLRQDRTAGDRRESSQSALNIVVVSTGSLSYGLVVDRLLDSEEIVIKPLGRHLQQCKGYAGATIMGDGRVALILDVANLATAAKLTSVSDRCSQIEESGHAAGEYSEINRSYLIFRSSETEHFGINLDEVERIEDITSAEIEFLGSRRVMQYKGGSLPLTCLDDLATVQPLMESDNYIVLVFNKFETPFGLLVSGPVDTTEITNEIDNQTLQQNGISGSAIVNNTTTMIVDIQQYYENCIV